MDKKKKINVILCLIALALSVPLLSYGQDVSKVQLMDKQYSYGYDKDTISLFFNILDRNGERQSNLNVTDLNDYMVFHENGSLIPGSISQVRNGRRIPSDYTFSVLIDLGIPEYGKKQIFDVLGGLVFSAPDSSVFLSFFGDDVQESLVVTKDNYSEFSHLFKEAANAKYLYSALYSKLTEFDTSHGDLSEYVKKNKGYHDNATIAKRAANNPERNALLVFTDGNKRPTFEENLTFVDIANYQNSDEYIVPVVYAFYYTENGEDPDIRGHLKGICTPKDYPERAGSFMPAQDMNQIVHDFEQIVSEKTYDYAFSYKVSPGMTYTGKTDYSVEWKRSLKGEGSFSIGSPERPWPERSKSAVSSVTQYLVAFLVALGVFLFFFLTSKVIVPWFSSRAFSRKYYRVYVPEENIRKRICHFCGQEIVEGQKIVIRCKHIMHIDCWKQNDYHCSEYGQNCKEGIQPHVHWKELFTKASFRDSLQTLSGIIAALIAWLVYDIVGNGFLKPVAQWIVGFSLKDGLQESMATDCVERIAAFLTIGLLLGFFLSLVFRYNDEYRNKSWRIVLKIIGVSLLSGLIGMVAFGLGGIVLCGLVGVSSTTYIPWYCSLPAYVFFALSVSAFLSWESSIPVKSALLGGGIASIIGFIVLFFTSTSGGWANILLDFIIFGGGLGASLVTVRMLSEHYFLIIQNGVRAGQKIPIHKWINATGGGNKVSIGMTGECEIQMNWEKSNKVAKEHAKLYIDSVKNLPMIRPLATGVIFNSRTEIPVGKPFVLTNGDTFKIGDTIFKYVESE